MRKCSMQMYYFIATAAEDGDEVWSRAASGLEGWVSCFPKAHLSGAIFGGNATATGTIQNRARKGAY